MIYVWLKFKFNTIFSFRNRILIKVNHGPEWNVESSFPNLPFTSIFLISGSKWWGILPNRIFSSKRPLTWDPTWYSCRHEFSYRVLVWATVVFTWCRGDMKFSFRGDMKILCRFFMPAWKAMSGGMKLMPAWKSHVNRFFSDQGYMKTKFSLFSF